MSFCLVGRGIRLCDLGRAYERLSWSLRHWRQYETAPSCEMTCSHDFPQLSRAGRFSDHLCLFDRRKFIAFGINLFKSNELGIKRAITQGCFPISIAEKSRYASF